MSSMKVQANTEVSTTATRLSTDRPKLSSIPYQSAASAVFGQRLFGSVDLQHRRHFWSGKVMGMCTCCFVELHLRQVSVITGTRAANRHAQQHPTCIAIAAVCIHSK